MARQITSLADRIRTDIVVQRPVVQHERLSAINPSPVNTDRIFSLLPADGVKIYSAILRMGIDGSKADNAAGGITCGLTEDGTLKKDAYHLDGKRSTKLPANGLVFEGYQLPEFEAAKQIVLQAHPMVMHFRLLAWDIAIQEDGKPVLIDANPSRGLWRKEMIRQNGW